MAATAAIAPTLSPSASLDLDASLTSATPSPTATTEADLGAGGSIIASILGTDTGLLLGLRADETEDALTTPSAYRTVWVSNDGEGIRERQFDRVIVTPKTEGAKEPELWMFQPMLQRTPTDTIQYITAHLMQENTRSRAIADDPNQSIVLSERLTYVGDDMVSLPVGASYWAGNGNAYSQSAWVKTFEQASRSDGTRYDSFETKWDDVAHLLIQYALGKKLTADYTNEANMKSMEAEQGRLKLARALGDNWLIERDGHVWTPKIAGLFDYPGSGYITAALPAQLLSTVQPIEQTLNWTAVSIEQPNATDAFVSSDRNYILMQTASELRLYAYVNDTPIGELIWTMALKPRETVVMCKWFTGSAKPEWSERLLSAYNVGNFSYPGYTDQP
jgi:hypothetical protein